MQAINPSFQGKFFYNSDFQRFLKTTANNDKKLHDLNEACSRLEYADLFTGYILKYGYNRYKNPFALLSVAINPNNIRVNHIEVKPGQTPYDAAYNAILEFGKLGDAYKKFTGQYPDMNVSAFSIKQNYTIPMHVAGRKDYSGKLGNALYTEA